MPTKNGKKRTNPDQGNDSAVGIFNDSSSEKTSTTKKQRNNRGWRKFLPEQWTDWLMVVFNCLLALFTYLLWNATNGLWEDAHAQLEVMKGQLSEMRVNNRPWVSLDTEVIEPMRFDKDNVTISVKIKLKNIGNSPAVRILPYPVLISIKEREPIGGIEVCPSKDAMSQKQNGLGYTLFREQTVDTLFAASLPRSKLEEQRTVGMSLVICVDYLFSSYQGSAKTINRYWITFPRVMHITTRNEPIPKEEIFLKPIGSYAD